MTDDANPTAVPTSLLDPELAAHELLEYVARTGDFGGSGHDRSPAIAAYQARMGMGQNAIGVVGPITRARALELGVQLPPAPPPKVIDPAHPRPLSAAARRLRFGAPDFTWDPLPGNPQHVKLSDSWRALHLVEVVLEHPTFQALTRTVHADAAPSFRRLWQKWGDGGLLVDVLAFQTFAPRFKRTLGTEQQQLEHCRALAALPDAADYLSSHSFGIATDVNPAQNPQGRPPAPEGTVGSVLRLVPAAEDDGVAWGGRFHLIDSQHFEITS